MWVIKVNYNSMVHFYICEIIQKVRVLKEHMKFSQFLIQLKAG